MLIESPCTSELGGFLDFRVMKNLRIDFGLIFRLLKNSAIEWNRDNAMRLSAALSYYSVFSIAPLLLIAIGLVGLVAKWGVLGFGPNQVQWVIEKQISQMAGPQFGHSVVTMVQDTSKTGGSITFLGFFLLLFGASTVFGQLKDALNTIWGVRLKASLGIMGMVRERVASFGMVLVIGFLLLISLVLGVVVAAMGGWLVAKLHLPEAAAGLFGFVLPLAVETLLFALIFQVLPDVKIRWRCVGMGAAVTALLFELGKWGLAWYLGRPSTTSDFATGAGSLVVLLLWVFYASCILFFGAEFTKVYAAAAKMWIEPSEIAELAPKLDGLVAGAPVKVGVEPHPLHPDDPVPAVPMKESLAPILAATLEEPLVLRTKPLPVRPVPRPEGWLEVVREHPVAQLSAAMGVGLVIGIVSRVLERRAPALSAADHFAEGSRKTVTATRSLLALGAAWVAKHLTKRALREYGERAQTQGAHWSHVLAGKLEKVMR